MNLTEYIWGEGGSYIKSPEWLASKRATINPKNENDYECLRCLTISAWNCNKIAKKEFENIFHKDFSSHQRDCERFEQNNKSIALNVLFAPKNSEKITFVYKSEHNYKREKNALLLMINNGDEKYYFAVKSKLELYSSE